MNLNYNHFKRLVCHVIPNGLLVALQNIARNLGNWLPTMTFACMLIYALVASYCLLPVSLGMRSLHNY